MPKTCLSCWSAAPNEREVYCWSLVSECAIRRADVGCLEGCIWWICYDKDGEYEDSQVEQIDHLFVI